MKESRIMQHALLGAVAALAVPVIAYMTIHFTPVLNAQEGEVLAFADEPLSLKTRKWKTINRTCPVSSKNTFSGDMPNIGSSAAVNRELAGDKLPVISFVLHGDETRMAVIDGYVLKEGNTFNGWRVIRIEQKRVQLENKKGKKWIYIN